MKKKDHLTEEELNFIQEIHDLFSSERLKKFDWDFVLWNVISSLNLFNLTINHERNVRVEEMDEETSYKIIRSVLDYKP